LAVAVATSSVNFSSRSSASGGSTALAFTVIAPHRRPSTMIGLPACEVLTTQGVGDGPADVQVHLVDAG
jgi:hypothetical protein